MKLIVGRGQFHMETALKETGKIITLPGCNDKKEFEKFFKHYYPRLLAYGELFLDRPSVEDIIQDLMVYLWFHADSLKIHTSVEAYLFKSVYQRCLNIIRQQKVRSAIDGKRKLLIEDEETYYDPEKNSFIRDLFSSELRNEIDAAIESLPPKCREAFIKSYIYNLKTSEIAEMLGISERTVETHIYSALKLLRKKLKSNLYLILPLYLGI